MYSTIYAHRQKQTSLQKQKIFNFEFNLIEKFITSLLDNFDGLVLVDPAVVVGGLVAPFGFELVAHSPHEMTLNVGIEDVHDALTECHDVVIGVEG